MHEGDKDESMLHSIISIYQSLPLLVYLALMCTVWEGIFMIFKLTVFTVTKAAIKI